MPKKLPPKLLPALTREDVLATAKTDFDRRVKEYLFDTLPASIYQSWFHNTNFVANKKEQFTIHSSYARNYINMYFSEQLDKAYKNAK